jgi:hypothetical protein
MSNSTNPILIMSFAMVTTMYLTRVDTFKPWQLFCHKTSEIVHIINDRSSMNPQQIIFQMLDRVVLPSNVVWVYYKFGRVVVWAHFQPQISFILPFVTHNHNESWRVDLSSMNVSNHIRTIQRGETTHVLWNGCLRVFTTYRSFVCDLVSKSSLVAM